MSPVLTGYEIGRVKILETEGSFKNQGKLYISVRGYVLSYPTFFS